MPREIAILGFLTPALLLILLGSIALFVLLDLGLSRLGLYGHVWHASLFRAALFTSLFCVAGLLLRP